ncbi:hypothetical protein CMO93_05150 [Candidatus Woesearchaeota archaeon]|nr:hypothetical protein [Candidatus Woesearchaeota archaeon]|tara:strand:- start:336 stop:1097 length:762 start_codon:yes stop_codon:yes gene_type:complete
MLNSTVNASGNYIEVTIDHLSTFGIFGQQQSSSSSSSSSSGSSAGGGSGGGGGSSKRTQTIIAKPELSETESPAVKEEIKEEKIEELKEKLCDYKIAVSLPERISLVELDHVKGMVSNVGNCEIENLNMHLDEGLKEIIKTENEKIENIDINKSIEFLLLQKLETNKASNLLIPGFNIKIPERNIETYNGFLTFDVLAEDKLAFKEKINIKVDVIKNDSTIEIIRPKIPIFSVIFLLFICIFYGFYRKINKKH